MLRFLQGQCNMIDAVFARRRPDGPESAPPESGSRPPDVLTSGVCRSSLLKRRSAISMYVAFEGALRLAVSARLAHSAPRFYETVQWWSHVKRCTVLAAATVFSKALDVPIHRATPPGQLMAQQKQRLRTGHHQSLSCHEAIMSRPSTTTIAAHLKCVVLTDMPDTATVECLTAVFL